MDLLKDCAVDSIILRICMKIQQDLKHYIEQSRVLSDGFPVEWMTCTFDGYGPPY